MLNARCAVRRRLYENHIDDVLIYGMSDMLVMPDFSYFDAANEQDWALASKLLGKFHTLSQEYNQSVLKFKILMLKLSNL
jgi:hypothetical protein